MPTLVTIVTNFEATGAALTASELKTAEKNHYQPQDVMGQAGIEQATKLEFQQAIEVIHL